MFLYLPFIYIDYKYITIIPCLYSVKFLILNKAENTGSFCKFVIAASTFALIILTLFLLISC